MSNLLMFPSRKNSSIVKELRACEEDGEPIIDGVYRQYTLLLLRRYFRMSIDMGKLPSVLGRSEFFRAKASSFKVHTFEDAVIFVHDMERSLDKLDEMSRRMIAGIVFLEYSRAEVADALGIYRTTVAAYYNDALDSLARILVDSKLIDSGELRHAAARKHRVNSLARVHEFPGKKPCSSEMEQGAVADEDGGATRKRQ